MAVNVIINGETAKMMSIFCQSCQEIKMMPSRRGRPPKYCMTCTNGGSTMSPDESQRQRDMAQARVRVDNLEMMLRSRGTHIQQQKDRW